MEVQGIGHYFLCKLHHMLYHLSFIPFWYKNIFFVHFNLNLTSNKYVCVCVCVCVREMDFDIH